MRGNLSVGGATPNFQEQLFGCVSQAFSIPQTDNRTKYPITLAAFCHWSPALRRLLAYSTWWPFPHLCESHHDLMARDASISEYSLHLREEKQWAVCCPSGDILECPTTVGRGIIEWGHCLLTIGLLHVNVRMKECLKMCLPVWHVCVCVCVYDQWDRWSASVDPECPKSRGRKWERYNYSRIVGCSRSKFLKNIPDRRTLLCLKYMHADFDPLNMVDLMWRELLNLSCIYLPSYDKTNWRRPWTERVNTLRMYYGNTLYHICVS